jgi:hypothetical protein
MPPILKFVSNTEHAYDMPRSMTLRYALISAEIEKAASHSHIRHQRKRVSRSSFVMVSHQN